MSIAFRSGGNGTSSHLPAPFTLDQLLRQILQADHFIAAQIHDLAHRLIARRSEQERLDDVVDVVEVAQLDGRRRTP